MIRRDLPILTLCRFGLLIRSSSGGLLLGFALGLTPGPAWSDADPCKLLTLEEVAGALNGPASMDRPHLVEINGVIVGGDCFYRSQTDPMHRLTVHVDAYPAGHQRHVFDRGRRRGSPMELSGVGDMAYASVTPTGHGTVTALKGAALLRITLTGADSVRKAEPLARIAAARLEIAPTETPAADATTTPTPSMSATSPQNRDAAGKTEPPQRFAATPPEDPTRTPSGAPQTPSGLDPALVGSWFLTQPGGRALANLTVRRDGVFFIELIRGGRTTTGRLETAHGFVTLRPENGDMQRLRYLIKAENSMEWIAPTGQVTVLRRRFQ